MYFLKKTENYKIKQSLSTIDNKFKIICLDINAIEGKGCGCSRDHPGWTTDIYSFHLKKWKRICINKRKPRY